MFLVQWFHIVTFAPKLINNCARGEPTIRELPNITTFLYYTVGITYWIIRSHDLTVQEINLFN